MIRDHAPFILLATHDDAARHGYDCECEDSDHLVIASKSYFVTRKLSNITLPPAFGSGCHVPPLSSNNVYGNCTDALHCWLYRCVHAPGPEPLAGAVSRITVFAA